MKTRISILFVGFIFLWALLLTRAAVLQILPNDRLKALEQKQFQTIVSLQNRRGAIVDHEGRALAMSTKVYSIYADPMIIEGKRQVAKKLSQITGVSSETIFSKIRDSQKRFVWLERLLSVEKIQEIKDLDIRGIGIVEEFKRSYPNENLLAQVIGYTGQEGKGLEGLELSYNQALAGRTNKVSVRRDARGRPLVVDGMIFAENPDGAEIKLTIDSDLQYMAEIEIQKAIQDFDADSAVAVILDPKTSAIRAMATAPTFDLNRAQQAPPSLRRNKPVTDLFEPGSTLKTFVIATALREKILQPNTKYDTEGGKFKIGNRIIREAETKENWKQLTVSEILAYSSNIGTTKIAFQLGEERVRKGLLDFGFGSKTGVDFPGEAKGSLHELPWKLHLLSNISFGHGIAVNALQMANAYAAIANGGVLNRPYMIESIRDPETGENKETSPAEIRRVLSHEEAAAVRMMLTGVTAPGGTGVNAKVDGFLVGGKTGTAQKVNPNGRGYLPKAYLSSFAGFIPATDPQFVIYVMVDHPKKNAYYGSQVAAPIFSRLASYAVRRAGISPVLLSERNFIDENSAKSEKAFASQSLKEKNRRNAASVSSPSDGGDLKSMAKSELANINNEVSSPTQMPNWQNLSLREVLRKSQAQGLNVNLKGAGVVSATIPSAGEPLTENQPITVIFKSKK